MVLYRWAERRRGKIEKKLASPWRNVLGVEFGHFHGGWGDYLIECNWMAECSGEEIGRFVR